MPLSDRGLLARLDTLVELVADRHGLALLPSGRLAAAEARVVARVAGLAPAPGSTARASGVTQREAVELLRALAEGVGLLRVRGDRLEATSLRNAWAQIDEGLRAGLVYAAWCHRVPWAPALGEDAGAERLHAERLWVLRLLHGLPAGVDADMAALVGAVAERADLRQEPATLRLVVAAFLEPLQALGAAELDPAPPRPPRRLRLGAGAPAVIGSALVAAGEEVPLSQCGSN